MLTRTSYLSLCLLTAVIAPCSAQGSPAGETNAPHFVLRRYPLDQNEAIAVVGSRTLTLGELVDHIDARHYPGFKQAVADRPEIQRMLQSDLIAPWVRHFADLEAMRQTLGEDETIDKQELEQAQSDALKASFEQWLKTYVADLQRRGLPTNLSQRRINSLLSDFQLKNGLAAELQGMLNYLEPPDYNRAQLRDFFRQHARYFGGQVTIAHILVQHRDAGTGILLNDEGRARANARIAEIKASLRPDGSNFEDVARRYSDDTRTGRDGGRLAGVHRFDNRLPATLCRTAWNLRDGEFTPDVVETQYGFHFVKRIEFHQQVLVLFTDAAIPKVRELMQRAQQENRLLGSREQTRLRLLL